MAFLGVKLTDKDQKILEEGARKSGKTLSDHIRDLIRNDHERHDVVAALQEIKNHQSNEIAALLEKISISSSGPHASDNRNELGKELQEIKRILLAMDKRTTEQNRIITLLGQASPFVSRQLGNQ